jgi:hypothetical protein
MKKDLGCSWRVSYAYSNCINNGINKKKKNGLPGEKKKKKQDVM